MKKTQRILAWIGIILLAASVIFFFFSAIFIKNPAYFRGSLACIILLPVLLYAILMMSKVLVPQKSPLIDGIIFDIGGVLVDFNWRKVMQDLQFSEETISFLDKNMIQNPLWSQFDTGLRTNDSVTDEFCEHFPEYETEIRTFISHLSDSIILRSYTHAWLSDLKSKGYQLYVLSNWSETLYHDCKDTSLSFLKYMDGIVWSHQAKCIKPNAEIYQQLLDKYDLDPSRCIFIDDRPKNVDGAAQLGIHTILAPDNFKQILEEFRKFGVK